MSTPDDDPEARYAEILRRIEGRKQNNNAPKQNDLAAILDGLNALGVLEELRKKKLRTISIYGPKATRGQIEIEGKAWQWAGAVTWYKARGYHHYRTLTLLGIWALEIEDGAQIIIGSKTMEFDAPVFNPESYYREIKKRFDLYYKGDGTPPPESGQLYSTFYDANERLALRDTVESTLATWAAELSDSNK